MEMFQLLAIHKAVLLPTAVIMDIDLLEVQGELARLMGHGVAMLQHAIVRIIASDLWYHQSVADFYKHIGILL